MPARLTDYDRHELESLGSSGELAWIGLCPRGAHDGDFTVCARQNVAKIAPSSTRLDHPGAEKIRQVLTQHGALFFPELVKKVGGYPGEIRQILWSMIFASEITNDSFLSLFRFQNRREGGTEGRFSLLVTEPADATESALFQTDLLFRRTPVVFKQALRKMSAPSSVGPLLRLLEDRGRIVRGMFVEGQGAMQFALADSVEKLRQTPADRAIVLAATDPANPFGKYLDWPLHPRGLRAKRTSDSIVAICRGRLLASVHKRALIHWCANSDDAQLLAELLRGWQLRVSRVKYFFFSEVNGDKLPVDDVLVGNGFSVSHRGIVLPVRRPFDTR